MKIKGVINSVLIAICILLVACQEQTTKQVEESTKQIEQTIKQEEQTAAQIEQTSPQVMSNSRLKEIIKEINPSAKEFPAGVQFSFANKKLTLLTSPTHNRMRIISAIMPVEDLTAENMRRMMEANFSSALDARYAVNDGILYAAYIHPLAELNAEQVKSGIAQVASLVITFGSVYSGGTLNFSDQNKTDSKKLKIEQSI